MTLMGKKLSGGECLLSCDVSLVVSLGGVLDTYGTQNRSNLLSGSKSDCIFVLLLYSEVITRCERILDCDWSEGVDESFVTDVFAI